MNPTRPARPIGLIFAAIILGLFALVTIFAGLGTSVAVFAMPGAVAAPAGPSPQFLRLTLIAVALFELLVAAWGITTIVGLIRLKSWSRYSILVIGGLLAFFGIISAAMLALLPAILAQSAPQPTLPPHLMQGMLVGMALFYIAIAAVGVWWLVYFNLRSVKAYFLPQYAAPAYPSHMSAASLATPGGLAEQPLPFPPAIPTGRFARVPTSIKVIACFFLAAAFITAVCSFLPFPAFIAGFFLTGLNAHLLYFAYVIGMGLIGIGLLRLDNRARIGVYALTALGLVNALVMLTPWGRVRYALYYHQLQQQMHLPPTPPALDATNPLFASFGLISALAFYGVILFLIERHRAAFQTPPQP